MVYILSGTDNYENISNDDGQTLLALGKYFSCILLSYLCSTSAEFQEDYFDYLAQYFSDFYTKSERKNHYKYL